MNRLNTSGAARSVTLYGKVQAGEPTTRSGVSAERRQNHPASNRLRRRAVAPLRLRLTP